MENSIWEHLVHLDIPVAEKILRPIIVYLFLVVGLRLAGKRELGQLSSLDLIVLLILSNTVQNAIIGNDISVAGGILGAMTLLVFNHLFVRFLFRHRKLSQIVEGHPVILIEHGAVLVDRMRQELITIDELTSAAHRQGYGSLDEADKAVLEPGGTIAFFGKKAHPDIVRQQQLLQRFDRLDTDLAALRKIMNNRQG